MKSSTYVDLSVYTMRYGTLITYYNTIAQICVDANQKFENTNILQICKQFAQATLPYVEINSNQQNIITSVGYNINPTNIIRCRLWKTLSRRANVLYGIYSNLDIEFIFNKILESKTDKQNNINLFKEKTRIVQTERSEANDTLNHIIENQEKLEKNIQYLIEQVQRNTLDIYEFK